MDELNERKEALNFYVKCFASKDFKIDPIDKIDYLSLDKSNIDEFLTKNLTNYYKMNGYNIEDARKNIEKIKEMIKERQRFFNSKHSKISDKLIKSYLNALKNIREYHFNGYGKETKKQNKTNDNILVELILLEPILFKVIKNIDKENLNTGDIEESIKRLNKSSEKLLSAKNMYLSSFYEDRSLIGEKRKDWRLARNKTCHDVLELYQNLIDLNDEKDIDEFYNKAKNNIRKGNNYYCYLDHGQKILRS